MNTYDKVVDLIKAKRKSNKYTQSELADKIGLSPGHYSRKELKKNDFTIIEVIDLFNIFDIELLINNVKIDSNVKLIKALRKGRKDNNLTQDYIRQKLLLKTHNAYFEKETGSQFFYLKEVIKMCDILNIEIEIKYINE